MSGTGPGKNMTMVVDYDPFAGGALSRVVPTTEPQREIWLADQLGRDASLAYNESVSLRLRGALDQDALRRALQALLDRHDALRSSFGPDGETLCIHEHVTLQLDRIDLSGAPAPQRDERVRERQRQAVETPFALGRDRLLRAELLCLADDEHVLLLTAHHIVCDGWSWWLLVRELGALYAMHRGDAVEPLPPAGDFADYALAQASRPAGATHAEDERYWTSRFAGEVPILDLPTDRVRPARRSFASAREDWTLDAPLLAAIRGMGARHGVSLFASLLASLAGLLARLCNQSQVVIGIPTAGQSVDGNENLVGHCVNTLPLLFEPDLSQPAARLVEQAQTTLLDALEHQRYTFGTLLGKLRLARDASRPVLVSVMFNIDQALDHEGGAFPGLQLEFDSNPRSFENFELAINAVQAHGELRLECQYSRALFDGATVRQWLAHWQTLLQAMVACADTEALGRLPLLADIERRKVLEKFNDTRVPYPADACLHELIEAQVERTPEAIAVSHEGAALSYAQLNASANRLAHYLRQSGVRPDQRVAMFAERSLEMVIGLLAILKSGAAYVPLDPELPAERLHDMLADCTPVAVLTQQALGARLAGLPLSRAPLALDGAEPAWAAQPVANPPRADLLDSHLAYVIYTSGSTGKPKGAMNEHRGIVNRLRWMQQMFPLDGADAVLQKTPYSFDVSVWEFFWPLMTGARLVVARAGGHRDPAYLADTIRRQQITTVHFVPSMLHAFLDHGVGTACDALTRVICSGEALPVALVAAFHRQLPRIALHNLYGPTEAAVDVTAWTCVAGDTSGSVPIGRPVANTRIYILDPFGEPVPVGVAGEIFIGGVQVGRGYLNRDALTAERFLPDPFVHEAQARMYRTGDLGRWRADGAIDYLGRNDFQVKLRGFRIELGEIESRLSAHADVAQALVLAREDRPGDVRLVAYVVARSGAGIDGEALSRHLRLSLPEYMVPQHYVALDAFPLSPNGKVDRKQLPAPVEPLPDPHRANTAPRDELEQCVVMAMATAIGVADIGAHDNFFELGGHSLLAARLIARLNREFDLALSLRAVFDAPTPVQLAAAIRQLRTGAAPSRAAAGAIPRRADRAKAPLSLMQQRVWYLEQLNPGQVVYHAPSAHRLRGIMDEAAFERALAEMVRRQPMLRTSFGLDGTALVQRVQAQCETSLLPCEDLGGLPEHEREPALAQRLQALIAIPFDLTVAPLFRARLFRLKADEHVFFFMPHHLIWDGWSFDLMYEEMSGLYAAFCAGEPPSLAPLAIEYGDFAAWHLQWMRSEEMARQLSCWRRQLSGRLEPLELPADRPRPPRMSGAGATEWIRLPEQQAASLRLLGRQAQSTLFMVLLTSYYVLLHRLSGQRDLIVNTPVRGRDTAELERVMGFFVNALPLRVAMDPELPFLQQLRIVRGVVLDAFSCPDVPFEQLVIDLNVPRDESRPPISQAMFSFQDVRLRPGHWGDLAHENIPVFQHGAADDLGLWFIDQGHGLVGGLTYNTDIFDAATVARWSGYLQHILAQALATPDAPVGAFALMGEAERRQVLHDWNATARDYDRTQGVPALIAAQMRRTPHRIAAECAGRRIDYAGLELATRAVAVALARRQVGRGDLVGICVPRSLSMLVAVLGVLRSGAAYVPLDPAFPPGRLQYMAAHARLRHILVTDAALLPAVVASGRELLDVDALAGEAVGDTPLPQVGGADLAYVLYTSGSTGQPKGVAVRHRNLVNFLLSMAREPGFAEEDSLCAATTLSFDIAGLELYLPLIVGGRTVIATDEQQLDPHLLWDLIDRSGCNVLQVTPAVLRLLQDTGRDRAVNRLRLFVGGEALPLVLANDMAARCRELWNLYGPTETTIWSTVSRIVPGVSVVPLGRPIANTRIHVLDARGQPVPPGVVGEIYIGGDGVADGYLFQPELTAERFIADPFAADGARMYRSGDLGAVRDGVLYFHGRADNQIKIRGFRIEPGDIEAAADSHPAVRESVVVAHEFGDNDRRMVLYVVVQGDGSDIARALREHLRERLPAYLLPQHIEVMDALPKTPNGKIDRKALPRPDAAPAQAPAAEPSPVAGSVPGQSMSDPRELYLAAIWRELIGVEEVRGSDNFLDLGGHSMLAVEFAARVKNDTAVSLRLLQVVSGTLASLAAELPDPAAQDASTPAKGSMLARWRQRLGLR
ncbi:MAG: amino acid adenylation domain-containing protein [Xanthomonadaceae bacterium]|nr:amino acid adenylation domain-containing protein [Xanthomonadaceae bacterium]